MSQAANNGGGNSRMHGTVGAGMIDSLRKSKWLPKYDDDGCNKVVEEINHLSTAIATTLEAAQFEINDLAIGCSVVVHHNSIERNRRLLMAYHRYRMNKIEDIRWLKGGILNKQYKEKLCDAEIEYFQNYSKLLNSYMKSISGDSNIIITSHLYPPKDIKNEFIINENIGTLITEDGTSHDFLEKNNRLFIPSNSHNVEMLLQNDKIQQINDK